MSAGPRSVLLVAWTLIAPGSARAFEVMKTEGGREVRWTAPPIRYGVAISAGGLSISARAAFDTWTAASGFVLTTAYEAPPEGARAGDGRNTIALIDPWDDAFGAGSRTIAHTEIVFDARTGTISEADVFLNGERFDFAEAAGPGVFDARSVIVHEAGHVLGLAHSCGDPGRTHPSCFGVAERMILEAVMAPTLGPGVSRHAPNEDDRGGLRALYPEASNGAASQLAIDGAARVCPEGRLEIYGRDLPAAPVVLIRYPTGSTDTPAVLGSSTAKIVAAGSSVRTGEGDPDVLVRDPVTGAYAVLYGVPASQLADCDAPEGPPQEGEGGSCTAVGGASWVAAILSAAAAFALRRRRARVFAAAIAACTALWGSPAQAYRCSRVGLDVGPSLVWETRQIHWVLGDELTRDIPNRDTVIREIQLSFQEWERPPCTDMKFPHDGLKPGLAAGYQPQGANENAVVFLATDWAYDAAVIAVTTNAFDKRTGIVFDSDIELNDQHFQFVVAEEGCTMQRGSMDLRNAVTHEAGHVLGLDHPPLSLRFAESTMFASAPACETKKRSLAQDDIDGLCAIYPHGKGYQQCFPPEQPSFLVVEEDDGFGGSRHTAPRGATSSASLLALAAAAAAAASITRRRRSTRV